MISSKRFRAGNDVQEALECNFKKETSMIVTHSRKNRNIDSRLHSLLRFRMTVKSEGGPRVNSEV